MLKEKFIGDHLPEGWFFDGTYYLSYNGDKEVVHPNLEFIINLFVEEENS
jgi:hypothetical protein